MEKRSAEERRKRCKKTLMTRKKMMKIMFKIIMICRIILNLIFAFCFFTIKIFFNKIVCFLLICKKSY